MASGGGWCRAWREGVITTDSTQVTTTTAGPGDAAQAACGSAPSPGAWRSEGGRSAGPSPGEDVFYRFDEDRRSARVVWSEAPRRVAVIGPSRGRLRRAGRPCRQSWTGPSIPLDPCRGSARGDPPKALFEEGPYRSRRGRSLLEGRRPSLAKDRREGLTTVRQTPLQPLPPLAKVAGLTSPPCDGTGRVWRRFGSRRVEGGWDKIGR